MLVSGYPPEYSTNRADGQKLALSELEKRALVNARAHAADQRAGFLPAHPRRKINAINNAMTRSAVIADWSVLAAFLLAARTAGRVRRVCWNTPGGATAGGTVGDTVKSRGSQCRTAENLPRAVRRGGAGRAHVGVLKVLEEYHVPIDCIAGNSMGALVGAAYATGTSVAEMEKIIAGISPSSCSRSSRRARSCPCVASRMTTKVSSVPKSGTTTARLGLPKGAVSGVQLETVLHDSPSPRASQFR